MWGLDGGMRFSDHWLQSHSLRMSTGRGYQVWSLSLLLVVICRLDLNKCCFLIEVGLIWSDISQNLSVSHSNSWCQITCRSIALLILSASGSFGKHLTVVFSMRSIIGACRYIMFVEIRSAALIQFSFIFILLVLRSHIMLVIVMLLAVAQSIGIFTHRWLNLLLAIQVLLGEGSFTTLYKAIAHHWWVKSWVHILQMWSLWSAIKVRSHGWVVGK